MNYHNVYKKYIYNNNMSSAFDATFWLSFITITIGFLGVGIRYIYKIKCQTIKCCCLQFDRNIQLELQEDNINIQRPSINQV
jgi:hypothetical protein